MILVNAQKESEASATTHKHAILVRTRKNFFTVELGPKHGRRTVARSTPE